MNRRDILRLGAATSLLALMKKPLGAEERMELFVPPEEGPHEQTFMQWPVSRRVHPDREFLESLQQTIADIANTIALLEPVIMLADKAYHNHARKKLTAGVELWDIASEDLWCRDSGPLFAKSSDNKLVVSHIQFNGWGKKQIHQRDGEIARKVAQRLGIELIPSGVIGEAGGVEHDGHGLLMAHESSWVNKNRNPHLSRDEIEQRLLKAYGAERMIWSPGVLGEDITDYHIDSLARFSGPGRVLINLPESPDMTDPFHAAAMDTYDALLAARLDVDVIPEPEYRRVKSIDFVASYANFYVCNGGVIAAQFGDDHSDEIARKALEKHYPDREVIALNVDALGEVGGGIHCATQQMPAI